MRDRVRQEWLGLSETKRNETASKWSVGGSSNEG